MNSTSDPAANWIDFTDLYRKADAISQAYRSNNLVIFLGAGASKSYRSSLPTWEGLINQLKVELVIPPEHQAEINRLVTAGKYLVAAEAIQRYAHLNSQDRDDALHQTVRKILTRPTTAAPNPLLHLTLLDFGVPIFTTNFDTIVESLVIEHQIKSYPTSPFTYLDERDAAELQSPARGDSPYIFKLHGSIHKSQMLILTESSYFQFYFERAWPRSLQLLRHVLATKMVLFIGFSLSDPEIMLILREATRYASSYQHLALMRAAEIMPTEREMLRAQYKVDTILFDDFSDLPLYVMEMRTFYRQDEIPARIRPTIDQLKPVLKALRDEFALGEDCMIVVFGSYARYGSNVRPDADVDVLFLTEADVEALPIASETADAVIGRRVDITVLNYESFLDSLRAGDPFASSVLVTGYALEDPHGRYGILSRGFRGEYKSDDVIANIRDRYRSRWLRLCLNTEYDTLFQRRAFYQWMLTAMQYFIVTGGYVIDNVLSASLLGKPTFLFQRFSAMFGGIAAETLRLLYDLKLSTLEVDVEQLDIPTMIDQFSQQMQTVSREDLLPPLLPGETLLNSASTDDVYEVFYDLADVIDRIHQRQVIEESTGSDQGAPSQIPPEYEFEFIQIIAGAGFPVSDYDYLYFIRLYDVFDTYLPQTVEQEKWLVAEALNHWRTAPSVDFLANFAVSDNFYDLGEPPDEDDDDVPDEGDLLDDDFDEDFDEDDESPADEES
ncbi:MAG: SIR2 family protein [Anaerolineae bacterium]|nr:SIR2 family protein [Anaerolineae bacterium]